MAENEYPDTPPLTQQRLEDMMSGDPARDPLQRQDGSKAPVVEGVRFASRSAEAPAPIAPRGVSSQAGLAAARGESSQVRSLPSVPAPGQPGSRFNPIVRERIQPLRPEVDPSKLIQVPTWSEPPAPPVHDPAQEVDALDSSEEGRARFDAKTEADRAARLRERLGPLPGESQAPGVSSQAGLAAAQGESSQVRSLPSVPAPGQPGSRFNPNVVPRKEQPREPIAEGQEIKVPAFGAQQAAQQGAAQVQEGDSIGQAASSGAVSGFVGGVQAASRFAPPAPPSTITREQAANDLFPEYVEPVRDQSHLDRFPELKGTEPLNGVTARFPELAPDADDPQPQQPDADQELDR